MEDAPSPGRPAYYAGVVRRTTLLLLALAALACGASPAAPVVATEERDDGPARETVALIPGTDLPDTPEARAAVLVLERYRVAFKNVDVDALLALASPRYHDDGGTPEPADDLDHAGLATFLARPVDFRVVDLALRYRTLSHHGNHVIVDVDYVLVIEIDGRESTHTTIHRMVLEPHERTYLFVSGM